MSRLYMRTSAEAHMYMDQTPCTCGDIEFDRQSAVMLDGGELCSRYSGKCRSCGTMREFIFQLPPKQRPITDQLEYGGSDPSRLLDAGQWLGISEYYAKLTPGTPGDLAIARAALEEVLKFMPEGVDVMPDTAFWTERGRMVREREPARFRRARLAAIHDVYRKQLGKFDLTEIPVTWTHTGDSEFPYTADVRSRRFTIRINDFPAEPLYTLMAEGRDLEHYDDWPSAWTKPGPPQHLLDLLSATPSKAAFEKAADDEEGVGEPGVTEPARIGARLGSPDPRSIAIQPQPREAVRVVKGEWYGGHPAAVSSIAFSPDGGRFVVGDTGGWLIIRSRSGEITARTQVPPIGPYSKPYVFAVAWSPANQYIATQDYGHVRLRNPMDLATVAEQDRMGVGLLAFGGGGQWLVSVGARHATIRSVPALADLATFEIERGHWDVFDIDHLAVDPEGSFIATGDHGGWSEDELGNSAGHGASQVTLIDGEKLAVTGDIEQGSHIHQVEFDRWRRRLLVLTSKGIGVWSLSGKPISRFAPYEGRTGVYDRIAGTVAIGEHWIVTLPHFQARRQTMDFWDPSTFKPLASIELPKKGRPGRITASPDGKMLVASEAGDGDFGVRIWSVE